MNLNSYIPKIKGPQPEAYALSPPLQVDIPLNNAYRINRNINSSFRNLNKWKIFVYESKRWIWKKITFRKSLMLLYRPTFLSRSQFLPRKHETNKCTTWKYINKPLLKVNKHLCLPLAWKGNSFLTNLVFFLLFFALWWHHSRSSDSDLERGRLTSSEGKGSSS